MKYYPRKIVKQIENFLSQSNKIGILLWPRQVWKTTILKILFEKTNWQKIYFDLERFSHCEKFRTEDNLISFLKINGFDLNKKIFLVVDEFQACPNSERIFKILYDHFPNIKIIASWSFSLKIKHKIQESLAWRKKIFYIYSLDLEEFIAWKKLLKWEYIENLNILTWFSQLKGDIQIFAKEYFEYLYEHMIRWGYPEVVLNKTPNEKKETLESIFDLYLKKDIINFLNIENIDCFKRIVAYLSLNNGYQITYNNLANFWGCSIHTVKNYIQILAESFLVGIVKPFYTNKNIELKKQPKIYFLDNGVRNWFIDNFSENLELREDNGRLFEWIFYQILIKNWFKDDKIKYWRTKDGKYEVDFLIDNLNTTDIFEIKFKNIIKKSDLKGIEKFKKLYWNLLNQRRIVAKYKDINKKIISIFDIYDLIKN
jgi:predicted AAA+ superfamily ATPase